MSFPYQLIEVPVAPEPLDDPRNTVQQLMAKLHNVILRGLNSMHANALKVEGVPNDHLPFVSYCMLWLEFALAHHDHEERIAFPWMQEHDREGAGKEMATNVNQHKVFHDGMVAFNNYLVEVQHGESPFSGDRIRKLLEAFSDDLFQHLRDEIPTLAPEKMQVYDKAGFAKMIQVIDKEVERETKLTTSGPFFMLHHDMSPNQQVTWPAIPASAIFLTQNVFYWVHSSWWKFAPHDRKFRPQSYEPRHGK